MDGKLPDFLTVAQALERAEVAFSASEVHGMACGMLALNHNIPMQQWMQHVLMGADRQDFYVQEVMQILRQIFAVTLTDLNSDGLSLPLLLPDDDDPIAERVLALQQWCQGLAFGVAASGIKSLKDLSAATHEWFEDVVKISSSGELDYSDEEGSEQAYMELSEFLSVGILMMNEEMQPIVGKPLTEQQTLH